MNGLRERFEDLAGTPAPPSRLTADAVYRAGWRRRQQRLAMGAAALLAVIGLTAGAGLAVVSAARNDPAARPSPDPTADGWPADTRNGTVISAVATDAEHVYAGVNSCVLDGGGQRACAATLMGSDDGGRTWTLRQAEFGDGRVSSPAPGVLLRLVEQPPADGERRSSTLYRTSTDGGRSWAELELRTEPVAEVPAGGWAECMNTYDGGLPPQPCVVGAFDPATRRAAPLATQPPVENLRVVPVPPSVGLWVTGFDDAGVLTVATSHDRGRSWVRNTLGAGAADVPPGSALGSLAVGAERGIAYAFIAVNGPTGRRYVVYRTNDGGTTWYRDEPGPAMTEPTLYSAHAYVAADGTHRLSQNGRQWWVGGAGRSGYTQETPDVLAKLGDRAMGRGPLVTNPAPGVFLAFDTEAVYRSSDGIRWTRHPVQAPPR
ncbi:hypothetical protein Val02_28780 [Virgisporangium aliadipatigenens]|uniref:Uncharacterized protein n=1 Tax=Virgisporangium aliadipatigenens TaxID=741659 RepID=A0A8J3YKB9_9ACTN|nr:hypothetical protein [Virgisporangium aliadipatigenens]GIJ45992.1 hypothetical protein Val02_28780 [Virgisporangium aliadipatigenens]